MLRVCSDLFDYLCYMFSVLSLKVDATCMQCLFEYLCYVLAFTYFNDTLRD